MKEKWPDENYLRVWLKILEVVVKHTKSMAKMNKFIKILKWTIVIIIFPLLSLTILLAGTVLWKLLKSTTVCMLWLVVAIGQILLVVGFFLLVAYMASKGWITI